MSLGDRIKAYEHQFTDATIDPSIPFIARVDGRAFHTYTQKLKRPFDMRFTLTMLRTTRELIKSFNPLIAYTQSDEITLLFKPTAEPAFGGKLSKLNSLIAATATYWFSKFMPASAPVVGIPLFDCRLFNVPDEWEAVNALRFRYRDAYRNSVSSAARALFGHKNTLNKNTSSKLEMMGDRWNRYPRAARFGVFYQRELVLKPVKVDLAQLNLSAKVTIPETCIRTEIHEVKVSTTVGDKLCKFPMSDPMFGIEWIANAPDVIFRSEMAQYDSRREEILRCVDEN